MLDAARPATPVIHDEIDALEPAALEVSRESIASIENELHLNGVTLKSFGSDEEESRVTLSSIQLNKFSSSSFTLLLTFLFICLLLADVVVVVVLFKLNK